MGKDIKTFYELNTTAKLTNKKEQWKALRELLPIEYMKNTGDSKSYDNGKRQ